MVRDSSTFSRQPVDAGTARTQRRYRFESLDYDRIDDTLSTMVLAQQDGVWLIDFTNDTLSYRGPLYDKLVEAVADGSPNPLFDRVHPNDAGFVADAIEQHLTSRVPYDVMLRLKRRDGSYDWVRSRGQASWDEQGRPVQMVGVMDDLSDAISLRQSLRDSEERLVNFANAVPGSVWRYTRHPDRGDAIEYVGLGGPELWEVSSEELGEDPVVLWNLIHEDDVEMVRESVDLSARNMTPWSATWRIRTPNGREKWIEGRGTPQPMENGAITWTSMAFDITERVETLNTLQDQQEMLHQSQKLASLGRIAGGVAHDFNNLLASILGNVELLLEDGLDEAERKQLASEIERATHRGTALSKQLLAFGRRAHLQPAAHDVKRVLHEFREMAVRVLPKNIHVVVQSPRASLCVYVDRNHLDNALLNLAINARDAMPDGGTLTFAADATSVAPGQAFDPAEPVEPGRYVEITVRDTGVGMTEDQVGRAIEPFYTTKGVGEGSGLGLSMVQGYARQSGGALRIDSSPANGTLVTLILPTAASPETVAPDQDTPEIRPVRALKVLVVEDNRAVRDVLTRQLEHLGHHVTGANDAREGCDYLSTLKPDLLITDLMMPGEMTSLALIEQARERSSNLPIMIISGFHEGSASEAKTMPADVVWLQKPVAMATLSVAISEVMGTTDA